MGLYNPFCNQGGTTLYGIPYTQNAIEFMGFMKHNMTPPCMNDGPSLQCQPTAEPVKRLPAAAAFGALKRSWKSQIHLAGPAVSTCWFTKKSANFVNYSYTIIKIMLYEVYL